MTRMRSIKTAFLLALLVCASNLEGQSAGSPSQPEEEAGSTVGDQQFLGAFEAIKRYSLSTPEDSTLWRAALGGLIQVTASELALSADSTAPHLVLPEPGAPVGDQQFLSAFDSLGRSGVDAPLLWRGALGGLISALDDAYAAVLTPRDVDEFREATTGNYAGIGVQISQLNDRITVTAVFRSTPAERVGMQVGDVIVGVDGESTEGWTTGDASERIRGTPGTMVNVSVEREGFAAPIPHPIERDQVHISSVTVDYVDEGVGYIHLDRVARNSSAEIDSAFTVLADARGVVLDLRGNPGGYLDESLTLTDLFLDRGKRIVSTRGRNPSRGPGEHEDAAYTRQPARVGGRSLVVLVDRYTASAGEILAGALQDHDRALVVGERTFGKGVVQSIIPLPEGWQLQLTTGEWYTPLGRSLHRRRDSEGRALPEDPDTFPVFTTEGGRELKGGGGVFPDLEIEGDTLLIVERQLLEESRAVEFPFVLRLAEAGFERAQAIQNAGAEPMMPSRILDDFVAEMREAGVPEATLEDPVVRDYLLWRLEIALSQRMNDDGRMLEFRIQRDSVLREAIALVRDTESQAEIFDRAASRQP